MNATVAARRCPKRMGGWAGRIQTKGQMDRPSEMIYAFSRKQSVSLRTSADLCGPLRTARYVSFGSGSASTFNRWSAKSEMCNKRVISCETSPTNFARSFLVFVVVVLEHHGLATCQVFGLYLCVSSGKLDTILSLVTQLAA